MAFSSFLLATCTSAGITDSARVSSVAINPTQVTVAIGAVAPLTASVRDADGNQIVHSVVWTSSDTSIARVSTTGVVTARTLGTARIAATANGVSGTADVTVSPKAVSSVRIEPSTASIQVGGTVQLEALTFDADGELLPGRSVTWSSLNNSVATVSNNGLVTGVSQGAVTITATSEGRSANAAVTVQLRPVASVTVVPEKHTLLVGDDVLLTATAFDVTGAPLVRTISWSSSATSTASVNSDGLVTAVTPGIALITAQTEGKSAAAEITVLRRPVQTVTVTPASSMITEGETQTLNATLVDDQGNQVDREVDWQSSNNAVATVNDEGVVTGVSPGDVTITATSEGKSGTAEVTVTPMPVLAVEVTPAAPSILTGNTVLLTAKAFGPGGKELTGRVPSWTSGAPSIAMVNQSGLVTGVTPGTSLIFATVEGVIGTASVTVHRRVVTQVTVTPVDPEIGILGTVKLTAEAKDVEGVVLNDRPVQWSSSNELVAFVTGEGEVIGLIPGTVTITATVEGVQGTTTVTVK